MPRLRLGSRVSLQDAHERSDALWRLCPMHAHAEYVATTGLGRLIFMRRDTLDFVCVRRSSERMHAPATASRARYNACLGSPSCRESPATDRHVFLTDLTARRGSYGWRGGRGSRGGDAGAGTGEARGRLRREPCRGRRRGSRPGRRCMRRNMQTACTSSGWALARTWLGPHGRRRRTEARPLACLAATHGGSAPWKLAQAFSGTAPGACMERTAAWGRRHACMQACMLPACCMPRDAC